MASPGGVYTQPLEEGPRETMISRIWPVCEVCAVLCAPLTHGMFL